MIKILGTSNDRLTCDCCGRRGLKKTVVLAFAEEERYYGVDCAARTLGRGKATVASAAKEAQRARTPLYWCLRHCTEQRRFPDPETCLAKRFATEAEAHSEAQTRNARLGRQVWYAEAIYPS